MTPHGGHGASSDDELDPDEPRTPLWLPLLGLSLFIAALIYLLTGQKPPEPTPSPETSASAAAPAPPPTPAPPPQ